MNECMEGGRKEGVKVKAKGKTEEGNTNSNVKQRP